MVQRRCKDCHKRVGKQKSFCAECSYKHRQDERRQFYLTHQNEIKEYRKKYRLKNASKVSNYNKEYSQKWYQKQLKMKNALLDDMIKNPRKYLNRVKI